MALPDYLAVGQGTAIIWGEAGATGSSLTVTDTLSLDGGIAADAGRMGASVDLTADWDREYLLYAQIESGTAPTAGRVVQVFLAWSHDDTNWPGGVTGSDAAYKAGEEDEWKKQLGPPLLNVVATNDANTIQRQNPVIIIPRARYVVPVVINKWDQAIRDETTATDNDSRVVLVPRQISITDSAPT